MKSLYKAISAFFCFLGLASVMTLFPLIDWLDAEIYGPGLRGLANESLNLAQYIYGMALLGLVCFFLASHFFKKGKRLY